MLTKQTANLAKEGKSITYDYDYYRLTGINYPDHPENNVKYYYGGRNASQNRIGRLMLREDGTGAIEYFYGKMGEVTKTRRTLIVPNQAIATYVTQWTYDSHNRLLEMIYPDEEKVTYSYNLGGQLEKVRGYKSYGYDYVNRIGYDKFEQRTYLKYCNGAETFYTYEPARRRLQNLTVNAGGKSIMDNGYTYDAVSNVLSVANKAALPESGKAGGQMAHAYTYDALYRLASATGTYAGADSKTASYRLEMGYDNMHRIVSKKQHLTQQGVQFDGTLHVGYDLTYTYGKTEGKKFQLAEVKDANYRTEENPDSVAKVDNNHTYTYDANGNLVYVNTGRIKQDGALDSTAAERKLRWDEENRLTASDDNGFVTNYWYDADGERTVKTSGEGEQLYVNSEFAGGRTNTAKFSLYVSPYLVGNQGGRYTKHIYIGSQRIVSKIGDFASYGSDPRRIQYAGSETDGLSVNYKQKYSAQQRVIKDNYAIFEVPYNGTDNNDYVDGQGFCCDDGSPEAAQARALALENNFQDPDAYEKLQFYYHPDHLGSSSYITNLDGEVVQHIEYVPFGEVFIEERNSIWNTPYLFNAKEFDEETGLYYYGARYYDPRLNLWISTDPKQGLYPNYTTYAYSFNNTLVYVDLDGCEPKEPSTSHKTREIFFGLRHPIIAFEIGSVIKGSTNISTNATRFATRQEVLYGSRPRSGEIEMGSENGAFRHTLWQATITDRYGTDIAKQIGNAHESNPFVDLSIRTFSNLSEADQTVDLLNNIIGRNIGMQSTSKGMKQLALRILDEFKEKGLYTAIKDKNGNYNVVRTKLSEEKYNKLRQVFNGLTQNGFTPEEQKVYDQKVKDELMQKQITWGTMK